MLVVLWLGFGKALAVKSSESDSATGYRQAGSFGGTVPSADRAIAGTVADEMRYDAVTNFGPPLTRSEAPCATTGDRPWNIARTFCISSLSSEGIKTDMSPIRFGYESIVYVAID